MKKLIAILITSVLLTQFVSSASARPKGSWEAVKASANRSIAVKTKKGETHYGLIKSIDDAGLLIQIAGRDDFTSQEINLKREEVASVWRATLRFGENNVVKAAWIGAGAGLGLVLTIGLVQNAQGSSDPVAGGALIPLVGAGAGAIAGMFWKKKHKKDELIYSV